MTSSLDMIRGRSNIVTMTNNSGGALIAGDVCVQDATADENVTTTTSAASTSKVFIAAESIGIGAAGKFYESGYCPFVNVSASATRGYFLFTHTVAKQATSASGYAAGAFGRVLKAGTTPSAIIYSATAQVSGAGVLRSGATTDGHLAVWNGSSADSIKDGGVLNSGDVLWSVIQASQLVNEFKGWPPIVNTGDLDALNLWWHKVSTPTTAPSIVTTAGEGLTQTWTYCIKCVTDGASKGLQQTWTFADEPRVKAARVMSVILAIWSVSSVSVTASLVNSDASHTDASAVTAAAWTIVTVENHTLAGTSCDLQVTAGAAGTFYVVPLGACIGTKAVPLAPRPSRYVDGAQTSVVSGVDPGGADYADVDCTATTSALAIQIHIHVAYYNATTAAKNVFIRRKGSAATPVIISNVATGTNFWRTNVMIPCDDGQIIQYKTDAAAGDGENIYIQINGWWEWA